MENWNKASDVMPDKNVNKEVVFVVPKESSISENSLKSTSGVVFYTWDNLPSLDWFEKVGGMWIETGKIDFTGNVTNLK